MATKLTKPVSRVIEINDKEMKLTIDEIGLSFSFKGSHLGLSVSYQDLIDHFVESAPKAFRKKYEQD